jgi:hypothetical protein
MIMRRYHYNSWLLYHYRALTAAGKSLSHLLPQQPYYISLYLPYVKMLHNP